MKAGSVVPALLLVCLVAPGAAMAQDVPPAGMAEVELARSRSCVAPLNRMWELDQAVAPYARRLDRLRVLGRAISLEDRTEAEPLDAADSVEVEVASWFAADSALAARWVVERDSTLQVERSEARTAILDRIRAVMTDVGAQAQEQLADAPDVEAAAAPCQGTIFVRPAVQEACAGAETPLCEAAGVVDPESPYQFVDKPEDLWDVSEYRPWSQPAALQATPQGAMVGGRTMARGRRGNAVISVALAPLIRNRSELTEEEVTAFQANLDTLGFTFDHPLFVMAPALEIRAYVPPPMGGETHILVHFGDLSGEDVIWSVEVGSGGVKQAIFPANSRDLARLQAGETVSMTAVRVVEEAEEGNAEAVYTVPLLNVNQAQNTATLLQYMGGGNLSRDLAALVPPGGETGTPGR